MVPILMSVIAILTTPISITNVFNHYHGYDCWLAFIEC